MRKLAKPAHKAKDVLALCTENIRSQQKKSNFNAIGNRLTTAETKYDQHGQGTQLFQLQSTKGVGPDVLADDMVWLYDNKLSKKNEAARKIYDEIKTSSKYGVCPLCAHRDVSTLDHYLAKTVHPLYAITPLNLLPACIPCNKTKSTHQAGSADKQTLHPYYDNADQAQWLKAKMVQTNPPGVLFYADPPADWPPVLRARVIEHFRFFGLEELYGANGARELANIGHQLRMVADSAGTDGVQKHLAIQAASRRAAEVNSWETAMYEALAASQWFWSGGHKGIVV